jgi:catechol 2,3-dioxygenase-like lactoylglutathione lyase family enzyme
MAAPVALADHIDHLVLTVEDIEVTTRFYERALGFEREVFRGPDGQPRHALRFGQQKINLQDRTTDTPTKALQPTFGSGDFCLIAAVPLDDVVAHLRAVQITIEVGPVARRGALGALRSVYFRDPDGNLVEVAEYVGG